MVNASNVDEVRERVPGVNVIVHPECAYEVVEKADVVGSTEKIIATITAAETGSAWAVETLAGLSGPPALTLGAGMAGILTRMGRASLREVLREQYILAARALPQSLPPRASAKQIKLRTYFSDLARLQYGPDALGRVLGLDPLAWLPSERRASCAMRSSL